MPLVSDLGHKVRMFPCRFHHKFGFQESSCHRFFHIHMLPGLQRQHRNREMRMIGSSNGYSLKIVPGLVEEFPEIAEFPGIRVHGLNFLGLAAVKINITQGRHLNHPGPGKIIYNLLATVAYSYVSYFHFLPPPRLTG